jgi:hydrogenase nickel incorporation protein HypB
MSLSVEVKRAVYEENDELARAVHDELSALGLLTVNVLGGAGAGKTSALIRLIENLQGVRTRVVEGDIESDIDTRKLNALGVEACQINTGGDCHLNAPMMRAVLPRLDLSGGGILFIENIGNLVCPAEFVIGEDLKLLVCSVPEGADKPYKYPTVFARSSAVLLNKTDLLPYVPFDVDYFEAGVRALNPRAPIFRVSSLKNEGFAAPAAWLRGLTRPQPK